MRKLSHPLILAGLNNISPIITFAISIFIARLSSIEALGNYYVLQAVYPLLLFVFNIAPFLCLKLSPAVISEGSKKILPIELVIVAIFLPTLMLLISAIFAPILADKLHISSSLAMVFFVMIVFPAGVINFLSGMLLIVGKHFSYAIKDPIYVFLKFSLILTSLIFFPDQLWLLFAAEFFAYSLVALYVFRVIKISVRFPKLDRPSIFRREHLKFFRNDFLPSLFVAFILGVLSAADALYVKSNFSDTIAGIYTVHSMIAKIPYFISSVAVMFIMSNVNGARPFLRTTIRDYAPIAILSLLVSVLLSFFRGDILVRFYGIQLAHSVDYFPLLLIHSNLIPLVQMLVITLLNRTASDNIYWLSIPIFVGSACLKFYEFATPIAVLEVMLLIDFVIIAQGAYLAQRFVRSSCVDSIQL